MFRSLKGALLSGLILLAALFVAMGLVYGFPSFDRPWWSFLFRWLHVLSGIMWVGLLYYLNFVQIPNLPKIPDEHRPAVAKVIMPAVLFWFRWAAMATIATGIVVAWLNGYLVEALSLGIGRASTQWTTIGVGMWLGILMWFNVWFVIWPSQKRVLGMVEATAEQKQRAARIALHVSRVNTALTLPMLFCMVAAQNGGFG